MSIEDIENRIDAEALVSQLPERERIVIDERFWGRKTLRETGAILGITQSRALQLQNVALARMRKLALPRTPPYQLLIKKVEKSSCHVSGERIGFKS